VQVEKILERFTELERSLGETQVWAPYSHEERERLATFLEHGRAVRAERERARRAGELPDFARLVSAWGGVSDRLRKSLVGLARRTGEPRGDFRRRWRGDPFVESMDPDEAVRTKNGWLKEVVFKRMRRESGRFVDTGERVRSRRARSWVAAGTSPNITYEKEHPGNFGLDDRRQFFARTARREAPTERFASCRSRGRRGRFLTSAIDAGSGCSSSRRQSL